MYEFRSFRNSDPPHLAEIWNSQPPMRGLAQPVSAALLELCLFSKQYFDPAGLIVATQSGRPIGFAHASFGPNETGMKLDTQIGTTQMLMVHGNIHDEAIADELVARSEAYQREHGATVHYAGGIQPISGFYLGLYGGSELPGILESDPRQTERFLRNHYEAASRVIVLHRELSRFRMAGAREARQVRRDTTLEQEYLPLPVNWWEACVTSGHERIRFSLMSRAAHQVIASVSFWDIEPLASAWGIPIVGMVDLEVAEDHRRRKVATHLLNEALRQIQRRGATVVEAQTMEENEAARNLYDSLGFTQVDAGVVYRKRTG